jgi:hypothetical protein
MKTWSTASATILAAGIAAAAGSSLAHSQAAQVPAPAPPPTAAADTAAADTLFDLNAMTFSCPKAALNAAAREAATVKSEGTYQFSYFSIINDAHHAAYEIRFRSNYTGEPELRYCVAVYCQQGWDPAARTTVTLMANPGRRGGAAAAHAGSCGVHQPPAARR